MFFRVSDLTTPRATLAQDTFGARKIGVLVDGAVTAATGMGSAENLPAMWQRKIGESNAATAGVDPNDPVIVKFTMPCIEMHMIVSSWFARWTGSANGCGHYRSYW